VNVSDVRLGGRVLQEDDLHALSMVDIDESIDLPNEEDEEEIEHRKGLLGSWSPPPVTTPLATLVGATDGLGLALDMGPPTISERNPEYPAIGTGRDNGAILDVDRLSSIHVPAHEHDVNYFS
jgi:hypothetical protein